MNRRTFIASTLTGAAALQLAPGAEILKSRTPEIERVIAHYDYTQLYYSQFFWVESAWWRLPAQQ